MAGSHHPDLPTSLPVWPPPAASKRNSSLGGKWLKVGKHERGGGLRCLAGRSWTANTGDTTLRGPPLGIQHSTRHLSLCAEILPTCKVRVGCGWQATGRCRSVNCGPVLEIQITAGPGQSNCTGELENDQLSNYKSLPPASRSGICRLGLMLEVTGEYTQWSPALYGVKGLDLQIKIPTSFQKNWTLSAIIETMTARGKFLITIYKIPVNSEHP